MKKILVAIMALAVGFAVVGCDKATPTDPFKSGDEAPAGLKPNAPKPNPAPTPGVTPTDPFKPGSETAPGMNPNAPKPDPAPKPGVKPTDAFAPKG